MEVVLRRVALTAVECISFEMQLLGAQSTSLLGGGEGSGALVNLGGKFS